ncbi:MAG: hypothetical protein NTY16_06610 [Deltaproteobacteria bacterium]|nr:hypothetical protein [Deltaproteobacteria bacterium]
MDNTSNIATNTMERTMEKIVTVNSTGAKFLFKAIDGDRVRVWDGFICEDRGQLIFKSERCFLSKCVTIADDTESNSFIDTLVENPDIAYINYHNLLAAATRHIMRRA